jgi:hypothetical protein
MKKLTLIFILLLTHLAYAQVPQGIPYQAAARNASGQALVNTSVKVRFSILDSVATGTVVYKETHSTTTNSVGLFNVNVGMGTPVTGTFNAINWGKNAKFMQMELDITGTGSSYVDMGTQQMLSVPYALYAGSIALVGGASSSNIASGVKDVSINGLPQSWFIPDFLSNCGTGADGSFTTSGNYTLNNSFVQYKNFTIRSGDVFTIRPASSPLNSSTVTILVKDTLTISGIIDGAGKLNTNVYLSNSPTSIASAGGPGGSSSSFNGMGVYDNGNGVALSWSTFNTLSSNIIPPVFNFSLAGGSGCQGTPAGNVTPTLLMDAVKIHPELYGINGNATNPNGNPLSQYYNGGVGGMGLYLVCKVLKFTGTINLSGSNGMSSVLSGFATVYGGGGGGGSVVISAETIIQNSGTINQNGGNGFTASNYCSSSKGGNGAYLIIDR